MTLHRDFEPLRIDEQRLSVQFWMRDGLSRIRCVVNFDAPVRRSDPGRPPVALLTRFLSQESKILALAERKFGVGQTDAEDAVTILAEELDA